MGKLFPSVEPAKCQPWGQAKPAWKRVPGRQADGLLQEGELWVVEAEDLVHHVGLGFHRQAEHGHGLATTPAEQDLPRGHVALASGAHTGSWEAAHTAPSVKRGSGAPAGSTCPRKVGRAGIVRKGDRVCCSRCPHGEDMLSSRPACGHDFTMCLLLLLVSKVHA